MLYARRVIKNRKAIDQLISLAMRNVIQIVRSNKTLAIY